MDYQAIIIPMSNLATMDGIKGYRVRLLKVVFLTNLCVCNCGTMQGKSVLGYYEVDFFGLLITKQARESNYLLWFAPKNNPKSLCCFGCL